MLESIEQPKEELDKQKLSETEVSLELKTKALEQVNKDIQLADLNVTELTSVIKELTKEIEVLKIGRENNTKSQLNELNDLATQIDKKNTELKDYEFNITRLEEIVNSLKQEIELLRKELIKTGTKVKEQESIYNGYILRHTALNGEIEKKTDKIKELDYTTKDLENAEIQLESVITELESKKEELDIINKKIEKANKQHQETQEQRNKKVNEKMGELDVKEQFLNDKHEKLKQAKKELEIFYGRQLKHINI